MPSAAGSSGDAAPSGMAGAYLATTTAISPSRSRTRLVDGPSLPALASRTALISPHAAIAAAMLWRWLAKCAWPAARAQVSTSSNASEPDDSRASRRAVSAMPATVTESSY